MKELKDYLYYEEENPSLKIYCGDCLEILPLLPKVDLVVTDPPYGIGEDGGKCRTRGCSTPNHSYEGWDSKTPDKKVFDLIISKSKHQAIFGGNYFTDKLPVSRGWLYWRKLTGGDFADGELIWTSRDCVLKEMTKPNKSGKNVHPTQKPVEVVNWCILRGDYWDKALSILDPFLGSGTTLVACKELNRNGIGIEISEKYCAIAKQRLKATTRSLF